MLIFCKISRYLLFMFAIMYFVTNSYAQDQNIEDDSFQVNIYGSLGGYGILYTVGCEFLPRRDIGINIGYSTWKPSYVLSDSNDDSKIDPRFNFFPFHLAYYYGSTHRFYTEAGFTYFYVKHEHVEYHDSGDGYAIEESGASQAIFSGSIGYNYCPEDSGIYFKAGTVFFYNTRLFIWANISIGYTFRI